MVSQIDKQSDRQKDRDKIWRYRSIKSQRDEVRKKRDTHKEKI